MVESFTKEEIKYIDGAWDAIANDDTAMEMAVLLSINVLARFGRCDDIETKASQIKAWRLGMEGLQNTLNSRMLPPIPFLMKEIERQYE